MRQKCFRDIAGFDDKWIIIIGLPIASSMISLLLFNDAFDRGNWREIGYCVPLSVVYTAIFWFVLRYVYTELKGRYPLSSDIGKRFLWLFASMGVLHFFINKGLNAFFQWLLPAGHTHEPSPILKFVATLLMSSLVIAIYEAISFYLQLQQAEAEKSELERQNVLSQLEGLRNQVNPHFLFNSLNTLIYLIPEDSDKAVRFVQQLSKVYRYVLESRDAKLIPLSEEIDFLNSYIFLQKERFGDNLQVQLRDIPDQSNVGIVPLSLQLLFENAIKHNIVSVEKPLLIEVFAEQDHLVIRNNLQRKNQVMDSTSVGLQNIIDRYKLLTNKVVNIIISDKYFTVALPIVHT